MNCDRNTSARPGSIESFATLTRDTTLAAIACHRLGLGLLSIFEVYDHASGASRWVQLAGSVDELFVTRRREKSAETIGNSVAVEGMEPCDSDEEFQVIA